MGLPLVAADVVILLPVYNDWEACAAVIRLLDDRLEGDERFAVICIDDGSSMEPSPVESLQLSHIDSLHLIRLRRNLGHQRAICVGLSYIHDHVDCSAVVIMDADGEDDPSDVPILLDRWRREGGERVIFAERTRRSEGLVFRLSYGLYRLVHRALTGRGVRVGNFSVISPSHIRCLVVTSELWSHYAAAVFVSRLPLGMVQTTRAHRIAGGSTMNYPALVVHGLSAISVFSETVSVRLLLAGLAAASLSILGILTVVVIRLTTAWAVPGWATYTVGILLIVLVQAIMFSFLLAVSELANRKGASMLPARDYGFFIDRVDRIEPALAPQLEA